VRPLAAASARFAELLRLTQPEVAPSNLSLGRHSYGGPKVVTFGGDTAAARIGSFVSIAPEVVLIPGGGHRTDWVSTYPLRRRFDLPGALQDGHPSSKGDIVIGSDVWLGRGAVVLSGVTIGSGAVVGASSVVSGDVPPYAIVAGNPATVVRYRFAEDQIAALLRIAWWDWPMDKILRCVPELNGGSVDDFIAAHD
jgi:acetyltransferase-like isoleucine patch superfamily enzyme